MTGVQTCALPIWGIITPGTHRLHHSTDPAHHNRNYGAVVNWWDKMFGTYLIAPDGKVIYEYTSLSPDQHVENTLRAVKEWAAQHPQQ